MNVFADRVKETSTTTGTGDITLAGAVSQFQSFNDALSDQDAVSFAIVGQTGTEWEVCIGTFTAPSTLERTVVVASSNGGAAVNFSAGTKDVFLTFSSADVLDVLDRANHTGTQAINTVTGLQTALDGKAASVHTHAISDTTGLQTALDGKAATSHTHAASDITSGLAAVATSGSASDLSAGTVPDARFPATLPAASGVNLTALNATNLASGTVDDARLSSNVALENAANDFTAAQEISVNGAASTPALKIDGTIFSGGTATTTKPLFLAEPSGSTSTNWSTSGTLIGGNASTGFVGRLLDLQIDGSKRLDVLYNRIEYSPQGTLRFSIDSLGQLSTRAIIALSADSIGFQSGSSHTAGTAADAFITREAAATIQMGSDSATPITQTLKGPDARAGTDTNTVGGHLQIGGGRQTGTANGGEVRIQTGAPTVSGTGAGTLTTRLTVSGTAITASLPIVTQGYTVAGLAAITPLVAGMRAHATDATAPVFLTTLVGGGAVVCPAFYDGTNWVAG